MPSRSVAPPVCPLCRSAETLLRVRAHERTYFECATCGLVFVDPAERPDPAAERARYETHENDPDDEGYRAFLARLADPLTEKVPPPGRGLDFGSGPGPTLSVMLEERGYEVAIYDPYFAPDPAPLERTYDFVTCTETAEHFFDPRAELGRLNDLVRPGGWLGVMTRFVDDRRLADWSYARDRTHVCFYARETLFWIGARFGWSAEIPRSGVALFRQS